MKKVRSLLIIVLVIGLLIVLVALYPSIQQISNNAESGKKANSNEVVTSKDPSDQSALPQDSSVSSESTGAGSSSIVSNPEDTGQEKNYCSDASREVESCDPIDHPVCGWFDQEKVQCDIGPCIRSTFPNECDACKSKTILYWTEGDCPLHN